MGSSEVLKDTEESIALKEFILQGSPGRREEKNGLFTISTD
jgi:hypothetical protein